MRQQTSASFSCILMKLMNIKENQINFDALFVKNLRIKCHHQVLTITWSKTKPVYDCRAWEGVTKMEWTYLLLSTATPTVLLGVAILATKLHWRAWGSHLWKIKLNTQSSKQCHYLLNLSKMQRNLKKEEQKVMKLKFDHS